MTDPTSSAPPTTPDEQLRELLDPFVTHVLVSTEPLRFHSVKHDSLVGQLTRVSTLTTNTSGEVFHAAYGSKPAGRLDALALLHSIDSESGAMVQQMGIPVSPTAPLKERLRAIRVELACRGVVEEPTVRSWWARARVYSQLDGPAYSPNVLCPTKGCFERGTIHIRLSERVAVCDACTSVWTDDSTPSFEELASWASWSSEHLVSGHTCPECAVTKELVAATRAERNH